MDRAQVLASLRLPEVTYLKLTNMFFDQAKDQCAALTAAIESGDVDDIKINLHTMKGTSGSLKIMEIYELVEPLYAQVQTGDAVALAKESLPKIQVILAEVRAAYTA